MKLILSPKDNLGKITLNDVSGFALEGETLLVVFESGRTRNYPLMHLWYYESHVEYHKTQPLVDPEPKKAPRQLVEEEDDDESVETEELTPVRYLKVPRRKRG
jgi:hypothetical protein